MEKYCSNCDSVVQDNAKFCPNCGHKIEKNTANPPEEIDELNEIIGKINRKITVSNNQTPIAKKAWFTAGFFFIIILLTFQKWSPIARNWALMAFAVFFLIAAMSVAIVFRSREEKLQKLINGDKLIANWHFTPEQKKQYVNYLYEQQKGKNMLILFIISIISIVVFGIFILLIDEGKLAMLGVLVGLIAFLSIFAFGMPYYYKYKNKNGDGEVLLGEKYAYINGYFHNWDFPLSGIEKVEYIEEPFEGIRLVYYYTDRTLQHSEELIIPANKNVNLNILLQKYKI